MPVSSFLKFLLSDGASLNDYTLEVTPDFPTLKRRLFLMGREQNVHLPDHYHRKELDRSLAGVADTAGLMTTGLVGLSENALYWDRQRIYVQPDKQNDWQELLTHIPPLVLQAGFMSLRCPTDQRGITTFYQDCILPNTRHTAIVSPRIQPLDFIVDSQGGLNDLHMHLNGSLETDRIWQDFLREPQGIYADLQKGFAKPKVKEQFAQESDWLPPLRYLRLLKIAQRLRGLFYDYLFAGNVADMRWKGLADLTDEYFGRDGSSEHEFLRCIGAESFYPHLLSVEALMYILILQRIRVREDSALASFFHFYLSILGLTNRLLVQQVHQKGFEQFQKITLNGMREKSERKYASRFLQMHGNDSRNLSFLEGRFSPQKTIGENREMIGAIVHGWEELGRHLSRVEQTDYTPQRCPQLRLIGHFIKKADDNKNPDIRFRSLRVDLWQRGRKLCNYLNQDPKLRALLVGIDAAASEFDTPPEVFAPVFRLMRWSGIRHFTYHAGEDFFHLIGGLRAIFEAIEFCGLQAGDRIGHATATGLAPQRWLEKVGSSIVMAKGDYLDDLTFCYHLIVRFNIEFLKPRLKMITERAEGLYYEVYGQYHSMALLEKAWLMRRNCPLHLLSGTRNFSIYDDEEWDFPITEHYIDNRKDREQDDVWKMFRDYHQAEFRKRHAEVLELDPAEILDADDLERLQSGTLAYMNKKGIVIEALPTSNIRIGFYRSFKSYHLFTWLKKRKAGLPIPTIVVGSDDTGIFATNIYNEYANLYCSMLNDLKMSHQEITEALKQLDEDGRIYRFDQ